MKVKIVSHRGHRGHREKPNLNRELFLSLNFSVFSVAKSL